MKSYKVEQFYNKNQFVIFGKSETIFQSYASTIAIIKDYKLTLGRDWDYSNTTLKHLYLFLNDYIYCFNSELREKLQEVLSYRNKNKRASIQKLIDQKIIKYNKNLQ